MRHTLSCGQDNEVLLVEPYRAARSALATLLRNEGLDVMCCGRQRRALELARRHHLDAIVTEVVFPDRAPCGEFMRRLRQRHPEATIVVVSGVVGCEELARWGYDDPIPQALRCGADACLPKPVDLPALVAAIERGHARRSAAVAEVSASPPTH